MTDIDLGMDETPDFNNDDTKGRMRFPSGQEVRKITDPTALQELLDQVFREISFIRAYLEFPDTDANGNIDTDWDRRARAALAIGMNSVEHIERQIAKLKKKNAATVNMTDHAALAEKQELEIKKANLVMQTELQETKKAKILLEIEKQKNSRIKAVRSLSWDRCFVDEAKRLLDTETWDIIKAAAESEHRSRIDLEVQNIASDPVDE